MNQYREIDLRIGCYLFIITLRFMILGGFTLWAPNQFGPSYDVIQRIAAFEFWGLLMMTIGGLALFSIIIDKSRVARVAVVAAATVTGFWAFSIVGAGIEGEDFSVIALIVWLSLAGKDLIVASLPFSNPVEKVLRDKASVYESLTKRS